MLYHASLNPEEYHFKVLKFAMEDKACGDATVWVAREDR